MRAAGWLVMLVLVASVTAQRAAAQAEVPAQAPQPPTASVVPDETSSELSSPQQMSPNELAALGLDSETPAIDTGVRISGFIDAGFGALIAPEDSYWRAIGAVPRRPTFYVGNVNLYISKEITETFRTALEVRLSFLPNGSTSYGTDEPLSTAANDYLDLARQTRWGGLVFQRAYLAWDVFRFLTVRIGQFLSPYGVWNVDHGSPVLIPVRRPFVIGVGWIPERQTGLEFFGRTELAAATTLGYHLTLSNGTGPISDYSDLDANKALGGRLFLDVREFGRLRIGLSGYYGRETNARFSINVSEGVANVTSSEQLIMQFDSLSLAVDLWWELGGLRVQTEWMVNQRKFTDRGRASFDLLPGIRLIPADSVSWGGYGLIGYRLPWLGIMPFVMSEWAVGTLQYVRIKQISAQFGLNIRPHEDVVFKVSIEHMEFISGPPPMSLFMTQAAWAF